MGKTKISGKTKKLVNLIINLSQAYNTDEILIELVGEIVSVCKVEGVTIYAVDHKTGELYSKVKFQNSQVEIRLPVNHNSIAGYTAKTLKLINIENVYSREISKFHPKLKFDRTWDKKSGFKTRSILSAPLIYKNQSLQGVIQLINCRNKARFDKEDEDLIKIVANSVATALFNQKRFNHEYARYYLLLQENIISWEELEKAAAAAKKEENDPVRGDIVNVLIENFNVSRQDMGRSLAKHYNTGFIEFDDNAVISSELIQGLNEKYLRNYFCIPLHIKDNTLTSVIYDPSNKDVVNEIKGCIHAEKYRFCVGLKEDILNYIDLALGKRKKLKSIHSMVKELEEVRDNDVVSSTEENLLSEDAPIIVKTVNKIIIDAISSEVSDIHIEPYINKQVTEIRFRKDGECYKYTELPFSHTRAITNRIKIMANLKLDDLRLPQSGKIRLKYGNKPVELRVEKTPTIENSEDLVLRILASSQLLSIDKLNMSQQNQQTLVDCISKPYGMVLVVGPTGSGKTTTLHSVLAHLNQPGKKIWTVEDPVEITQHGIRQVEVKPYLKPIPLNFSTAMRSFLRADPDIIMVGEMRDKETASVVVEASLTGHLILSTLHTNSAPETITRIIDMGLNPINLAEALLLVVAQRLVRKLCYRCRKRYSATRQEVVQLNSEYAGLCSGKKWLDVEKPLHLYKAVGCKECNNAGYSGRLGLYELMQGTFAIKKMIKQKAFVEDLRQLAVSEGMKTLKMDGIEKVINGFTDMIQVLKVCIE